MHNKMTRASGIRLREKNTRRKTSGNLKWIILVTLISFSASGLLLFASSKIINDINTTVSAIFILFIVFIGIFADMLGIAVTAADETQFHSMAAKRIRGARLSVLMIRHANKVSSFLNDVVGDICGIISGSVAAMLVVYIASSTRSLNATLLGILFSGATAGLTIGGKASGKTIALKKSNTIVYRTAFFITFIYSEKWGNNTRRNDRKKHDS